MLENKIESHLKDKLENEGFLVLKLVTPAYTGTPDRIILWPKYAAAPPVFVETKAPSKENRPLQAAVQQNWIARGADVRLTVSTIAEADLLIDDLLKRAKMKKELWLIQRGKLP